MVVPNYLPKIIEFFESHPELHGRDDIAIDTCHDEWCAMYDGQPCNCDPEIRLCRHFPRKY